MLAQSGGRQRSGKRRLREGKRTTANRRSALRKCRNAVSAGVLSPISSAVGRNGAVGDKRNARAGGEIAPAPAAGGTRAFYAAARRHLIRPLRGHLPLKGKANGGASFNTATHQGGRLGGGGGRSEKRLPWLGQAVAGASAPVNAGTVLLSDNDDERLCPREYAGNRN